MTTENRGVTDCDERATNIESHSKPVCHFVSSPNAPDMSDGRRKWLFMLFDSRPEDAEPFFCIFKSNKRDG